MKPPHAATIIATACGLSGCPSPAPGPADSASPVVAPASVEQRPPVDVSGPSPSATAALPPVPPSLEPLFQMPAWQRFRAQWRELDAVAGSPSMGMAPSNANVGAISEKINKALDEIAEDPATSSLQPEIVPTLRAIAHTRLAVLSGLEFRLMTSHRMPSDQEMAVARTGSTLEQRIDALIDLRARGSFSPQQYELALQSISNSVHLLIALQCHGPSGYGVLRISGADKEDSSLSQLETDLKERRANNDAGSDPTLLDLERCIAKAKGLAPAFDSIVANLEQ